MDAEGSRPQDEGPPLGEQELELLRFVARHAPVTGGEAWETFGAERELARTTVLTVLERLRKKGYLTRKRVGGVFHYSPRLAQDELLQGLVRRFVEGPLGGSISPVVAYLTRSHRLSEAEVAELEQLVDELKREKGGEGE